MSEGARELLIRGVAAAKAKEKDEARFYLEWVLRADATRDQKAQAWLWLSGLSDDPKIKRNCLEEALAQDPANQLARRGLALLDGRLDPQDIIDPSQKPAAPQLEETTPKPLESQRFVCSKCGGKMAFKAGGKALQCEYCGEAQTLFAAMQSGAMVQEHDFTVAMATAKGHSSPVGTRPFVCQGCGASFLLASGVLSLTCSYCGSAHVVELAETRQLILPEGIIPFAVPLETARRTFQEWFTKKGLKGKAKVAPVRGLYLPAWTFDLSGEIRWQCYVYRDDSSSMDVGGLQISFGSSNNQRRLVREEGSHLVYEDDILIPASHKLPPELMMEEAECYVLADVAPFDEAYLADWPAQVYEIAVSDASLVARRVALERARRFVNTRVGATLGNAKDLQLNTSGLIVESFKLLLLPVWVARYRVGKAANQRDDKAVYTVIINGQTGKVRAQEPQNWVQKFFGSLFD
jgi:DNA-directed RNA polymerase subunit RPC12/RpoP